MAKLIGSDGTLMELYEQLYRANHLVPGLPEELRDQIRDSFWELYGRFHEEMMKYWNPSTLDDVRRYPPSLWGPALVYLINRYAKQTSCEWEKMAELDELKDFLWDDEANATRVLSDAHCRTVGDVVSWFSRQAPALRTSGLDNV